jgi:hypothetical protein
MKWLYRLVPMPTPTAGTGSSACAGRSPAVSRGHSSPIGSSSSGGSGSSEGTESGAPTGPEVGQRLAWTWAWNLRGLTRKHSCCRAKRQHLCGPRRGVATKRPEFAVAGPSAKSLRESGRFGRIPRRSSRVRAIWMRTDARDPSHDAPTLPRHDRGRGCPPAGSGSARGRLRGQHARTTRARLERRGALNSWIQIDWENQGR